MEKSINFEVQNHKTTWTTIFEELYMNYRIHHYRVKQEDGLHHNLEEVRK